MLCRSYWKKHKERKISPPELPAAGLIRAAAVIGRGGVGVVSPDERLPEADETRRGLVGDKGNEDK